MMGKQKKVPVKRTTGNGLLKRVEILEQKLTNLEASVQDALNTLSQGIADNIGQMWENQKEISAALTEMSESTAGVIKEMQNAKR